jgi:hypothetical protein
LRINYDDDGEDTQSKQAEKKGTQDKKSQEDRDQVLTRPPRRDEHKHKPALHVQDSPDSQHQSGERSAEKAGKHQSQDMVIYPPSPLPAERHKLEHQDQHRHAQKAHQKQDRHQEKDGHSKKMAKQAAVAAVIAPPTNQPKVFVIGKCTPLKIRDTLLCEEHGKDQKSCETYRYGFQVEQLPSLEHSRQESLKQALLEQARTTHAKEDKRKEDERAREEAKYNSPATYLYNCFLSVKNTILEMFSGKGGKKLEETGAPTNNTQNKSADNLHLAGSQNSSASLPVRCTLH